MEWIEVLVFVTSLVSALSADQGILLVRYGHPEHPNIEPFCIQYESTEGTLSPTYEEKDFHPLVDLTPDPLCEIPTDTSPFYNSIVVALGSPNCTVTERGAIAEEADAVGVVVVSVSNDLSYGNTTTNITEVVMSEDDHLELLNIQNQHKDSDIEAVLYAPELPPFDPNIFVIWTLAVVVVAIGGYWSGSTSFIVYKKKLAKRARRSHGEDGSDAEEDEDEEEESLTMSTAIILGWVVLIVAFLLLLFFFYNVCVYIVIFMFCLGAWNALFICLIPFVRKVVKWSARTPVIPLLKTQFYYVSIVFACICLVPVVCWFVYRHEDFAWILQDILGAAFCISVLKIIHMPNFKLCVLLLGLLFIYDLFFVFITPLISKDGESVMIKVATGGEGATEKLPILFMFPSFSSSPYRSCKGYSLLGFGDVLIPGLLVGFCHGFDLKVRSMKVYFVASVCAYGVGLLCTFLALILMETGQPALVYIVPITLFTVTVVGLLRRELKALWNGAPLKDHAPLGGAINAAAD